MPYPPNRNQQTGMYRYAAWQQILFLACCVHVTASASTAQTAQDFMSGSDPLTISQPLDVIMVDGINRHALRSLKDSVSNRSEHWRPDYSNPSAYIKSVAANRDRFRTVIGAVDGRITQNLKEPADFELLTTLNRSSVVARSDGVVVHRVRWPVLKGVTQEGLLLVPTSIRACVVAIPDADWTPEMFCGLTKGIPRQAQLARRLAEAGCLVAVPTLISRSDEFSGSDDVGYTNLTHREFLYRQAFQVGRHIIGYEIQKVLAAVDLFEHIHNRQTLASSSDPKSGQSHPFPIGVAGVGEGALLALYAASIDRRIRSTLVCGYYQAREDIWQEPIYRNIWGLLTEFGDAELARLVAPRRLVIEACRAVESSGPPEARAGRRQAAAPGRIAEIPLSSVQHEFARGKQVFRQLKQQDKMVLAISGEMGQGTPGSLNAMTAFATGLRLTARFDRKPSNWRSLNDFSDDARNSKDAANTKSVLARQRRQFHEIQDHIQRLLKRSPKTRDAIWKSERRSVTEWIPLRDRLRDMVEDEVIGRIPQDDVPFRPRTRRVLDTPDYTGYQVMIDVVPNVIAGGILLLPKDLTPGERRPVIVCQHGLEGTSMDTITHAPASFRSYKAFSHQLCQRGFIVYAPQNPYRGRDRFRSIQRKSNPLKRSLFSYIIAQHRQTLEWLSTLPMVDANRIAFYGLSYGGKTAMRVPPFVDRYCLSICSGDFTDWIKTITTVNYRYGYIFTGEYEIPEWNMAHVASYAELAMLMSPRPFMVEQGHRDGGTPTEWVASEFGKVRRHYDFLKLEHLAEIEFFDGPHTINGQGTFNFLHRHLKFGATKEVP